MAPLYNLVRTPLAKRDTTMDKVFAHLPEDADAILDLGTGPGVYAIRVAGERPSSSVTAVDFSSSFVRIAAENARKAGVGNVTVQQGDAEHLALPDDTYGAVICGGVLSVVTDRDKAIREVHRVLRPGGTLVIREPARHTDARERWSQRVFTPLFSLAGRLLPRIDGLEKRVGLLFGHFDREHFDEADLTLLLQDPGFASSQVELHGTDLIAVCQK